MLKEEVCGVGSTFAVSKTNESTIIINIIADSGAVRAGDRSHIMVGFYFALSPARFFIKSRPRKRRGSDIQIFILLCLF